MKTSDIGAVIDKFIESNATAIMFNGNWGIGKTYAVQQLLSEDRYKKEIYDYIKCVKERVEALKKYKLKEA